MPPDYSQLRALVVDDNTFTRRLICEVLRNLGFNLGNLIEAGDGLAALNILETESFDLVISDWHMKPMDGLTFTRKIRDPLASPALNTPIILCTADPQQDVIKRALQIGVNQVIAKPINIANFSKRLRAVFDADRLPVKSGDYLGPDRRYENDTPPHSSDRRTHRTTSDDEAAGDTNAEATYTSGVRE